MARRGGGRGGAGRGLSFNVESLGFGRGEALPNATAEPPPVYPPLLYKPSPLEESEETNYLLALKQEFRSTLKDSPYFIKAPDKKSDINRYSDKYQLSQGDQQLHLEFSRLPRELRIRKGKRKAKVIPSTSKKPKVLRDVDVTKHLELLEKKEKSEIENEDEQVEGKTAEDGEAVEDDEDDEEDEEGAERKNLDEGELDEEDLEEDNDYSQTYFDNGENYAMDEDDDLEDGPTY